MKGYRMPWIEFEREDAFEGSDQPFITITPGEKIFFSAVFCRLAGLGPDKKVRIYVETDDRKLAFEFGEEGRYALCQAGRSNRGNMPVAMSCSCAGLVRKLAWVEAVAHLPNRKDRRFTPRKEGTKWVIQLCPAFEQRNARESEKIPADAIGIYRYLRDGSEVVYIGRGHIRDRLAEAKRKDWDFDTIEYSIVKDPDAQSKWEGFWLRKYAERNKGKAPLYNVLLGSEPTPDSTTTLS
jgi:hypothetical protein